MPTLEYPKREERSKRQYPNYLPNTYPCIYDNFHDEEAMSSYTEIFDVI